MGISPDLISVGAVVVRGVEKGATCTKTPDFPSVG